MKETVLSGVNPDPICDLEMERRSPTKVEPGPPQIVICMPVGNKTEARIFKQPEAGMGGCQDPACPCQLHGKELSQEWRNQGLVPVEWAVNHMQMVPPLGTTIVYLLVKNKYSGPARDEMTRRALDTGAKYIFYWDDDVLLPAHAFHKLHNVMERFPDVGLLSGVVCVREDPTEPMVYREQGKGAWWGFSIDPNHPPEDIFAAGGGCLMVRMEAIRKMTPPYWLDTHGTLSDPHAEGRSMWGHDWYFIRKLREESGYRTCVMGSVLCGHWDVEKQREYVLPKDSPPFHKQARLEAGAPWKIEECPAWDSAYLYDQLRVYGGERRMFLVPRRLARSAKVVREVMASVYTRSKVISSGTEHWLAVGEEMRNGGNHSEPGHASGPDRSG